MKTIKRFEEKYYHFLVALYAEFVEQSIVAVTPVYTDGHSKTPLSVWEVSVRHC